MPISRSTSSGEQQPLVYPSSFNTPDIQAVQPIEDLIHHGNGPFHYGPRSLKLDERPTVERKKRSYRVKRSAAELGVQSAYEVVSEVDLDFTPDLEEERRRITVFQVRI